MLSWSSLVELGKSLGEQELEARLERSHLIPFSSLFVMLFVYVCKFLCVFLQEPLYLSSCGKSFSFNLKSLTIEGSSATSPSVCSSVTQVSHCSQRLGYYRSAVF